ncbi:MAG: hypothetical protein L6427_07740 [Actinomycetia bacterium]|nr:hypothetical protein [Actinomycetes bacterium]MCG2817755.1 hypothetical protein [Actinomycetes bacterium]
MARVWSSYADAEKAARLIVTAYRYGPIPSQLIKSHKSILSRMAHSYPGMVSRYFEVLAEEAPDVISLLANDEEE